MTQSNNWGLFQLGDQPIDVAALKGKTVGIYNDSWTAAMLPVMLESGGLTMDDIDTVAATGSVIPLLLSGKIDVATEVTNLGGVEISTSEGGSFTQLLAPEVGAPDTPIWVYVANSEWAAANPDLATAWLDATRQGIEWASQNPEDAVALFDETYPEAATDNGYNLEAWKASIPLLTVDGGYPAQTDEEWASCTPISWTRRSRRASTTRTPTRPRRSRSSAACLLAFDGLDTQICVPCDDVEVAVVVQERGANPERDGGDQAVHRSPDDLAPPAAGSVDGRRGLEGLDAAHGRDQVTRQDPVNRLCSPFGSRAGEQLHDDRLRGDEVVASSESLHRDVGGVPGPAQILHPRGGVREDHSSATSPPRISSRSPSQPVPRRARVAFLRSSAPAM
jgi:hypothetical protein